MTDTGYITPTLAELITRIGTDIQSRMPGSSALLRRSLVWVLTRTLAGVAWSMWQYQAFVARQLFLDTATTLGLARLAAIWGITRVPGTQAAGTAGLTGTTGTTIPEGTMWRRDDGYMYRQDHDVTLAAGVGTADLTCQTIGLLGDCAVGRELQISSPVAGCNSTATVVAITGGQDDETDSTMRQRLALRIAYAPNGGSALDYVTWALECAGVINAWCYPLEDGAGTVTVRFVVAGAGAARIPDAGEVATVQAYIETKKPVTATVTVEAPTANTIDMDILLSPNTAAVQAAVEAALDSAFLVITPGEIIRLSQLDEAISQASGEVYHTLSITGGTLNQTAGMIPIRGTITWL